MCLLAAKTGCNVYMYIPDYNREVRLIQADKKRWAGFNLFCAFGDDTCYALIPLNIKLVGDVNRRETEGNKICVFQLI